MTQKPLMTELKLHKINKHSVRYDQPLNSSGPLAVYVPNEALKMAGHDPAKPPKTLLLTGVFK